MAAAGCSGDVLNDIGGGGGDSSSGADGNGASSDLPPSLETSGLGELLHAPGTFGADDHYQFSVTSPAAIDAVRDELGEESFDALYRQASTGQTGAYLLERIGVDFWDVGTHYSAGPVSVLVGTFDRNDIWRRLQYQDWSYQGNYGGYALLSIEEGDDEMVIALEGEGDMDAEDAPSTINRVILGIVTDDTSSDVVRSVIDVAAGDEDRYVDEVDSLAPLLQGLDIGAVTTGWTSEATDPESLSTRDTAYLPAPVGQEISSTLSPDTEVSLGGREYTYMERYGFTVPDERDVTITVRTPDETLGIVLFEGDGGNTIDSDYGVGTVELTTTVGEGNYNFVVYDRERYQDSSGPAVEYTLAVEVGGLGGPEQGQFEGVVGRGSTILLGEDVATRRWVVVFENQPPMDDITTWISENGSDGDVFGPYDDVEKRADGTTAIIEGTIPLSDLGPEHISN